MTHINDFLNSVKEYEKDNLSHILSLLWEINKDSPDIMIHSNDEILIVKSSGIPNIFLAKLEDGTIEYHNLDNSYVYENFWKKEMKNEHSH